MAVKYSNSSLVNYTKISPNKNTTRVHRDYNPTGKITKITIHHMAGNLSVEACGDVFAPTSRQGSSNYGIGTDGRVGLYVDEKHRAWTSSSPDNDYKAVTIEVANDGGESTNWHVSDKAYAKLIDLCVDICKRNGITKLNYTGDATGNLTRHNMFAATACPGQYLQSKFEDIENQVNKRLASANVDTNNVNNKVLYRVQVGAFGVKSNANAYLKKAKAAGFDAFIVKVGKLYKIQVGAFGVKANADAYLAKVKAAGFSAFLTTESGEVITTPSVELKTGDKVKLKSGAYIYGTKTKFAPFVYSSTLYVRQINGDRVVISTQKTGDITGEVNKKDLTKI